jgi:ABC-type sugar transport system substrate-binding protein
VVLLAGWASFGCDSASFVPPVNPELRGDAGAAPVAATSPSPIPSLSDVAPAPARPIELVLAYHNPDETELWKTAARTQAGLDKVKLHVTTLGTAEPASKQAELIREVLTRKPRVLIVEPAAPADAGLAEAVAAAQGQGIPVILVGRPLAGGTPAPAASPAPAAKSTAPAARQAPIVVIEARFAGTAKQIVEATIRVAQVSELVPAGGAIIVTDTNSDPYRDQRELAIKDALKAVGITTIEEVRFAKDPKAGEKLLTATIKAHPKIDMVFTVDSMSSAAVKEVANGVVDGRLLIAGGFTTDDQFSSLSRIPFFAAVAEFTPARLLRKAISSAVALTQGKDVPSLVEFRINVSESSVKSNVLRAQLSTPKKSDDEPARVPGKRVQAPR